MSFLWPWDLFRYFADVALNHAETTSQYLAGLPPELVDCAIKLGKALAKFLFP